ncbi:NB-ARC domain-containing protein [Desmonostoc muscorum LEGE 12446]|uniref:AAA family ATPase n=1 Tax=Desmonostoc muscorum LEGE 12446 TaxID=1828758 RepID=A0A8J6ZWV0_DESMC|nr:NB-ARC domain-containing protein [Desmonostoc muscorum]MCF2152211.1 NB-ARC domain-containing protein [Desmonostoc muscorum LEGE 12446]
MDAKKAVKVINDLVFAKQGRWLEEAEKIVIEAAWLDLDYKEIAENGSYTYEYLQRRVAPTLWVLLTGILGSGEKVTKKRLRRILENQARLVSSKWSEKLDETPDILPAIGGYPPDVSNFYGRTPELAMLKELVAQERCIALIGPAGIGKSALVAKLFEFLDNGLPGFDAFVWKPLFYAPSSSELVGDLLKLLFESENQQLDLPEHNQARVSMLLDKLRSRRYLIVLDAAESILQGDRNATSNPYGVQYADYGIFFKRLVEEQHKSCLLLTSREPFVDIVRLQRKGQPARIIKIEGLGKEALEIFRAKGLTDQGRWVDLVEMYRGNPLALQIVASRIQDFFGGSVEEFFKCKTTFMTDLFQENLDELFGESGRLTNLEKKIMFYLAETLTKSSADSIPVSQLLHQFKAEVTTSKLIEALEALIERSLLEQKRSIKKEVLLSLQPLVRKYVFINCSSAEYQNVLPSLKSA